MKHIIWTTWIFITCIILGMLGYEMIAAQEKPNFLIGDMTHGHYQIELACTACHTESFGGDDIIQDACTNCHAQELEDAHDSHPKKKFTDPRNADRLEVIDARYCVSCHTEHKEEQTHPMGLTLPTNYCYHCHQEIFDERESHKDLEFDSCASAGCHNYHDNRALYERFLVENSSDEWLNVPAHTMVANTLKDIDVSAHPNVNFSFSEQSKKYPEILAEWEKSAHADAGIQCGGCHVDENKRWTDTPTETHCQACHQHEVDHFYQGKHGMRLAQGLSPMTPKEARLPFKAESLEKPLTCNSCHGAHEYDLEPAVFSSCIACHDDDHSNAFETSPHGKLLTEAIEGIRPMNEAVTCATCHMPTVEHAKNQWRVEHNQNATLRPNEKMIRPVCMQCHSLDFAIDALADPALIQNNFTGQPKAHIPSIDWAKANGQAK